MIEEVKRGLAILGSTGSIGTQALEILAENDLGYRVQLLTARSSWEKLEQQARRFKPQFVFLSDRQAYEKLKQRLSDTEVRVVGPERVDLLALLGSEDIAVVINALVGFAGFLPSVSTIKAGKRLCLANKESLVVGGALINQLLENSQTDLIPVDSEHSAIFQCLMGEHQHGIDSIILTASGGPFRDFSKEELENVSVEQALNHPNWDMGPKITIDSSTMMNKGLEVIEAHWLFNLELSRIQAVIHPPSLVHSMVAFKDGSIKAHLGIPDMKVPIAFGLTYPDRTLLGVDRIDWNSALALEFRPIDEDKFRCFRLCKDALEHGGASPAVLNAANEVAVDRFLNNEIRYIEIPQLIERSLDKLTFDEPTCEDDFLHIDAQTRTFASEIKI